MTATQIQIGVECATGNKFVGTVSVNGKKVWRGSKCKTSAEADRQASEAAKAYSVK